MKSAASSGALRFFGGLLGISLVLGALYLWVLPRPQPLPLAREGILTITRWQDVRNHRWPLRGQWEMYWRRLWSGQPQRRPVQKPRYPVVPSFWNHLHKSKGEARKGFGYATYRLRVLLPKTPVVLPKQLQIKLSHQLSAAKVWILEELPSGQVKTLHGPVSLGKVGRSLFTYRPEVRSRVVTFQTPASRVLVVVYQIANFHHVRGGLYMEPVLGVANLDNNLQRHRYLIMLLVGIFFCMACYHFLLFLFRSTERAPLWMGWLCLIVALRSSLTEEILYEWADTTFLWQQGIRLEYITTYLPVPVFLCFLYALYPNIVSRRVTRAALGVGLAFSLFTVFTPTVWHTQALTYYHPMALAMILYSMIVLVISIFQTDSVVPRLIFIGCFAGLFAGINDILYTHRIIQSTYLLHYGIAVFILLQVLVLAIYNQQNRRAIEVYAEKLEAFNHAAMRFVPRDFLSLLGKNNIIEVQLSDNVRTDMAVMFSDIRGFTTLSETMTPRENFEFVNELLRHVSPIIREHNGFIVKYMGDGMMAVFPHSADHAVRAAVAKLQALERLNQQRSSEGLEPIRVGVGINYGPMMLGIVGEEGRLQSDVVSDAVNLASRVEGATKRYNAAILITDSVRDALSNPNDFAIREVDLIAVKGKQNSVKVYEVFDTDPDELRGAKQVTQDFLEQAITLYRQRDVEAALALLHEAQTKAPTDPVIQLYIERCEYALSREPNEAWDVVERLEMK